MRPQSKPASKRVKEDMPNKADFQLRCAGFSIHCRPAIGKPLWERCGRLFTEAEAHQIAKSDRDQLAAELTPES